MRDVYILAGARTPFSTWARGWCGDGRKGGALAGMDAFDLGAAALQGALDRSGLEARRIDRLVFGNMYQDGPHGCYGAMYVRHRAGLPPRVHAMTVNMACGTGLHALIEAAQDISCGDAGTVAVAGADTPSRLGKEIFLPSFYDISCNQAIGLAVEELAIQEGISRGEADAWAALSHARAAAARAAGRSSQEIVAVGEAGEDDHVWEATVSDRLAGARTLKGGKGLVTSANTHGIVDGASALILAAEKGINPWGRFVAGAYAGVAPERMGVASIPAIQAVLTQLGAEPGDIDLYEINETFSAQLLLDIRALNLPQERVNVNGGAVALGHPFAGTGGRQVITLLQELRRRGLRRGIAAICIGGGQGVAVAVESL